MFEEIDYVCFIIYLGEVMCVKVLYEDEYLMIVNKFYGIKIYLNQLQEIDILLNYVVVYLVEKNQVFYVVY